MPGAIYGHRIAGRTLFQFEIIGSQDGVLDLGYTLDGARLSFAGFERPIFGDQNGGQEGPPVDVLAHGQLCDISGLVLDYNWDNYHKLIAHKWSLDGTPFGMPEDAGTLLLAGGWYINLYVLNRNDPFFFPTAFMTNPHDQNLGTNETQQALAFRALRGGVNRDVSQGDYLFKRPDGWTPGTDPPLPTP